MLNGAEAIGSDDWEEFSDTGGESQREPASSASGSQAASTGSGSLRKNPRVLPKATPSTGGRSGKRQRKKPVVNKEDVQEALTDGVRFTTAYALDVFVGAIQHLRKPLTWLLVLWMFAWLVSRMTETIRTAFSPLCIVPGMSRTALCAPAQPPLPVNFPRLVNIQETTFEKLAGQPDSDISTERVLKAELATRDLSVLVRFSDLKSKDNIADMLHTIVIGAKKTGRGLSKLNARVVGAIDEVMALNNYAMATIEGAHRRAPSPILQAISPFKLGPTADEIILSAFTVAMDQSEATIAKLIVEADQSRQNLDQMDVDIMALHEMIIRENKPISEEREELLGELWTKLGGNKKTVREYGDRKQLLDDLGKYRGEALAHVTAALQTLRSMSDELDVLRDRVAAPALVDGKLPLHVHIESIKNGLERLKEGRMRSRGGEIGEDMVGRALGTGTK
ncbi:hypothetical protein BU15DRAFT_47606 [Melanogaster broomeanus]|nr:hypothetical protein BU15DRAFT_47606 [Melanogaster broomeanus]